MNERQKFITSVLEKVLGQQSENKTFDWFINKHTKEFFETDYESIDKIFIELGGDIIANKNKQTVKLRADSFFGGKYNFLFEFDELQHFTTSRLFILQSLPKKLKLNYNIDNWINLCKIYKSKADEYRRNKTSVDFDFPGGRTAQRAYLDSFRDFLPIRHRLNSTLRINIFEVQDIHSANKDDCKKLEGVLKLKL